MPGGVVVSPLQGETGCEMATRSGADLEAARSSNFDFEPTGRSSVFEGRNVMAQKQTDEASVIRA